MMEIAKHYELHSIDEKIDASSCVYKETIAFQFVNMRDKALVQSIIAFAQQEGITDLYLIDSEFVKTALMREMERRKEGDKGCMQDSY